MTTDPPQPEDDGLENQAALPSIDIAALPFETDQLRAHLKIFLDQQVDVDGGVTVRLGSIKWGVYAFYDYDGEPIYVGQTKESLGTRIRRHLTNQRTDAVAMNVLDPYEVNALEVYPLPQYQQTAASDSLAKAHLNALEYRVFEALLARSEFCVVLNEKEPPPPTVEILIPIPIKGQIVSPEVSRLRDHPDLRIARRAGTLAKLAQVISERKVKKGLRGTLLAQSKRLQSLAQKRLDNSVDTSDDDDD